MQGCPDAEVLNARAERCERNPAPGQRRLFEWQVRGRPDLDSASRNVRSFDRRAARSAFSALQKEMLHFTWQCSTSLLARFEPGYHLCLSGGLLGHIRLEQRDSGGKHNRTQHHPDQAERADAAEQRDEND